MERNTCPNPFILLDKHQAPATSTPRLQVQDKNSSSSSRNSSSSTFEFDSDNPKMRNLSDIYAQDNVDDIVNFAFPSFNLLVLKRL